MKNALEKMQHTFMSFLRVPRIEENGLIDPETKIEVFFSFFKKKKEKEEMGLTNSHLFKPYTNILCNDKMLEILSVES